MPQTIINENEILVVVKKTVGTNGQITIGKGTRRKTSNGLRRTDSRLGAVFEDIEHNEVIEACNMHIEYIR